MGCGASVPGQNGQVPVTMVGKAPAHAGGVAEAARGERASMELAAGWSRESAANKSQLMKMVSLKEGMTPKQVLDGLMDGNIRFVNNSSAHPHQDFQRIQALTAGQKPQVAILGCADSRVPAEIVFDQGFGDVFVCRVAGNIATPEEVASLEYGVLDLNVKVVMVLGHTKCGAVKAAISGKAFPGFIDTLVENLDVAIARVDSPREKMMDSQGHPDPTIMNKIIKENVRYQLERCKRSSIILEAVKSGRLLLVGAVYDLDSGRVELIQIVDQATLY